MIFVAARNGRKLFSNSFANPLRLALLSSVSLLALAAYDSACPARAFAARSHHPGHTNNPTPPATPPATPPVTPPAGTGFTLSGLVSPATVAQSIFISSSGVPATATVSYFVDGVLKTTETSSPYWMGGLTASSPNGFSVAGLETGEHTLSATATLTNGTTLSSNVISLNVVPSINSQLSATLSTYVNQPTAQSGLSSILSAVTTPGAPLTATELATRQSVLAMYMNWGIDPSLDSGNDISSVLQNLEPKAWQAPASSVSASSNLSMAFSPDSPYYHAIPAAWPKVQLPSGYVQIIQVNSAYGGDGIGFGETTAASSDPQLTVTSEWYSDASTMVQFPYHMKKNWNASLPTLTAGDSHMLFTDPTTDTFVSTYKTTMDQQTGGPTALYAPKPTSFNSLGDVGGSVAAHFAELPVMIQPGEATNATQPIRHAIGGPVGRTWAARVFPAIARDSGIMTSANSCSGTGYTNTGLVPYGGVIQLDPSIDLTKLGLSLPALRILQAMQTYGYYVMDFGCDMDLDIYTGINETEVEPFGGMYGNVNGPGVQNEIQRVLSSNDLYVVAPLTKKQ
jgi:hypothetical protein